MDSRGRLLGSFPAEELQDDRLPVLLRRVNGLLPLLHLGGVVFAQVEDAALAVVGADVAPEVPGRIFSGSNCNRTGLGGPRSISQV